MLGNILSLLRELLSNLLDRQHDLYAIIYRMMCPVACMHVKWERILTDLIRFREAEGGGVFRAMWKHGWIYAPGSNVLYTTFTRTFTHQTHECVCVCDVCARVKHLHTHLHTCLHATGYVVHVVGDDV